MNQPVLTKRRAAQHPIVLEAKDKLRKKIYAEIMSQYGSLNGFCVVHEISESRARSWLKTGNITLEATILMAHCLKIPLRKLFAGI